MYTHSKSESLVQRMQRGFVAVAFIAAYSLSAFMPFINSSVANAVAPEKSYVCKYVGTPGVDETLQTGGNPIHVNNNSLPGYKDGQVVEKGSVFSDDQGRSIVIYANTEKMNPEPSVSECPAPTGGTKVAIPATPNVTDPCGVSNAEWVKPANTATVTWSLTEDKHLVASTVGNSVFTNDEKTHDYGVAVALDSGVLCETLDKVAIPATPNVTDPCGVSNAEWVKPANTATVTWSLTEDKHLVASTVGNSVFTNDEKTHDYGVAVALDSGVLCEVAEKKSYVCKWVGTPGVDERLQTGNNPIWVSNNSLLKNDKNELVEVGDEFPDAQGRSIVIFANVERMDPEPTLDDCLPADEPELVVATKPTVVVVCGPNNDIVTPLEVTGVTYKPTAWVDGKMTVTATAQEGYYFGYEEETEEDEMVMITTMSWEFTDENTPCGGNVLGDDTQTPNVLAAVAPAAVLQDTGNDMLLPMLLSTGILGLAIMTMLQNSPSRRRPSRLAVFLNRGARKLQLAFAQPFSTV
jgi:hypothetical protein